MWMGWFCGMLLAMAAAAPASAQSTKQLSEKNVNYLLRHAWLATPERCETGPGKSVTFEKMGKSAEGVITVEVAREVVTAARRTSQASTCGLEEEARMNYCLYLTREQAAKNWSPQQRAFAAMVFFMTDATIRGSMQLGEENKITFGPAPHSNAKDSCTETQKASIQASILAYKQAGPTAGVDACIREALYPYCRNMPRVLRP